MHAGPIDTVAHFGLHLAAQAVGMLGLAAIGRVVAAHHHHPGVGPSRKDAGQRAHELVKAAGGFQIARHIGHDFIGTGQRAVDPAQTQLHIRIGQQRICADAVVTDVHLVMKGSWKAVLLPFRRTLRQIHAVDVDQRHGVVCLHDEWRMVADRAFGIKADGTAGDAVVIFEKADDRHIGVDFLHEGQLAPADVPDNDVGRPPFLVAQALGCHRAAKAGTSGVFPCLDQPISVF